MYGQEVYYIALLFALFILPKVLQRFRIPAAITAFCLGALAGPGLSLFQDDPTIKLLSTLGIVALFLFAGLELNLSELRQHKWIMVQHVVIHLFLIAGLSYLIGLIFGLEVRVAVLVALALSTPSAGFILDSIKTMGVDESERFWIRSKVISTELVALAALFFVLQSKTALKLSLSTLILIALIVLLPLLIKVFARLILPYAPKSEFAFVLMLAVVCAFVTRELGVYYLVGAFVTGLAAQRLREEMPAQASEQMLHAVEVFASFFVPFYFFGAGAHLQRSDFAFGSLLLGLAFLLVFIPLRVSGIAIHRRLVLGESFSRGARIGISMLPTLVFTLVIAEILRDEFGVSKYIFGGLIVYTIANTLIPGFALKLPLPQYEAPHALKIDVGNSEKDQTAG